MGKKNIVHQIQKVVVVVVVVVEISVWLREGERYLGRSEGLSPVGRVGGRGWFVQGRKKVEVGGVVVVVGVVGVVGVGVVGVGVVGVVVGAVVVGVGVVGVVVGVAAVDDNRGDNVVVVVVVVVVVIGVDRIFVDDLVWLDAAGSLGLSWDLDQSCVFSLPAPYVFSPPPTPSFSLAFSQPFVFYPLPLASKEEHRPQGHENLN